MKPIHCRGSRPGYTLVELITTLILLGAFTVIATRMFVSTLRVTRQASDSQNQAITIDSMVRMLRADVWSAADVRTVDKRLIVKRPDAKTVTWSVGENQIVRMEEGSKRPNRWSGVGPMTLDGRGDHVIVRFDAAPSRQGARQLLLMSQIRLAQKEGQ